MTQNWDRKKRLRLLLAPPGGQVEKLVRYTRFTWNRIRETSLPDTLERLFPAYKTFRHKRQLVRLGEFQEHLQEIFEQHSAAKEIIVFAPSLIWKTRLFQRPNQLAVTLARQGNLVFFCEPPDSKDFKPGFHSIEKRLYIFAQGPWEVLQSLPSPVVFTLAYNQDFLAFTSQPRVVYEYIDELSVFPGAIEELQRSHQVLVHTADVVVATARKLYQEVRTQRDDALFCPNAVDYDFIHQTILDTATPPEELESLTKQGQPIIGYYGALAKWFDYGLVIQAAQARPDYQFVLIGPDYDWSIRNHPIQMANIHWLGPKEYKELPRYLKYFDVATIPFVLNEVTHSTSPLKLFEYMAGGKPIVTTAMRECQQYPTVLISHSTEEFIEKLDEALRLRSDPQYLEKTDQTARENTWDLRVQQILEALPEPNNSTKTRLV